MTKANNIYHKRINNVINYITENLNKSFTIEELAGIAHFSPYHFHRIFVAVIGESVIFYTNRIRLEKAARLLKYSSNSISNIAYDCGFSSPSTFSRSFKQYFMVSPSTFRKNGELENSKNCKELFPMEEYLVPMSMEEKKSMFPVTIKDLPRRRAAYIRIINSYRKGLTLKAFEKLVSWSKHNDLFDTEQFFGMSLDDPIITPKAKCRYEACMTIPDHFQIDNRSQIETMILPKCRYASVKVTGNINIVATATSYLFNDWLLNSNYEPEHQNGLENFLDRKNICNWNHFELELCVPVKPLKIY